MRARFFVACGSVVLGAAAACTASGTDPDAEPMPDADAGQTVIPTLEAGTPDADASDDVDAGDSDDAGGDDSVVGPVCSPAGWCATALPASDLLMKVIWPLPGRAFVAAESPTLGVKILEWDEAAAKWSYIDDGSQNVLGRWAGGLWAPNDNELYYGVSPNFIYHGTRSGPGAAFSWTRQAIGTSANADDGHVVYTKRDGSARVPSLGVWGTSADDVYAWFKNAVYHWTSVDGGAPEWVPEYSVDDRDNAAEASYFFAAAGTGPNDVWFAGARTRSTAGCALVVRKTSAGFKRVADGTITGTAFPACNQPRAGALFIGGAEGWLTDLQVLGQNELIGLKGARDVVKISVNGDVYSYVAAPVPTGVTGKGLNSLTIVDGDFWLGGAGLIVRGTSVWDGGTFAVSTAALSGLPLNRAVYQVKGSSNSNLWAIGVRHALHKTTP